MKTNRFRSKKTDYLFYRNSAKKPLQIVVHKRKYNWIWLNVFLNVEKIFKLNNIRKIHTFD